MQRLLSHISKMMRHFRSPLSERVDSLNLSAWVRNWVDDPTNWREARLNLQGLAPGDSERTMGPTPSAPKESASAVESTGDQRAWWQPTGAFDNAKEGLKKVLRLYDEQ